MKEIGHIAERLRSYLAIKQVIPSHLAKSMGVHPMVVKRMLDGSRGYDAELVIVLGNIFPRLNLDWLLSGEGAMEQSLKEEQDPTAALEQNLDMLYKHREGLGDQELADRTTSMLALVQKLRTEHHKTMLSTNERLLQFIKVYQTLRAK